MARTNFEEFGSKSNSILEYFKDELKKIRSGRANPSMVEDIQIEAYGEKQPLKNLANISVVDAQLLTVQPWDKSLMEDILKGIQEANIGINPSAAGELIRLPLPPLTEERRHEYVKIMKDQAEEARISIRNLRKDVLVGLSNDKKNGDLAEDDFHRMEKDIQKQVDEANKEIEEIAKKKEEELITV